MTSRDRLDLFEFIVGAPRSSEDRPSHKPAGIDGEILTTGLASSLHSSNLPRIAVSSSAVAHPSNADVSVESLLDEALDCNASDIHIEPFESTLRIRFRIDGRLQVRHMLNPERAAAVAARVKVLSGLDIAEKRRPQDGRFRFQSGDCVIDLRVSVLPTLSGEKVAIRILRRGGHLTTLSALGFQNDQLSTIRAALKKTTGMIVVTGPTGSGKTTTIYAALRECMSVEMNVCTLEDPVEYDLAGANQSQIREDIGYSFGASLRALLRQDPDIIMVGEMRDSETASIAIRAALTGHLVFTTLHTNNALAAVARLRDMGVESFLIASALSLVIAQRLVRLTCSVCKGNRAIEPDTMCRTCQGIGFRDRTAIFEIVPVDDELRRLLTIDAPPADLEAYLRRKGMMNLEEAGQQLVTEGQTKFSEIAGMSSDEEVYQSKVLRPA